MVRTWVLLPFLILFLAGAATAGPEKNPCAGKTGRDFRECKGEQNIIGSENGSGGATMRALDADEENSPPAPAPRPPPAAPPPSPSPSPPK